MEFLLTFPKLNDKKNFGMKSGKIFAYKTLHMVIVCLIWLFNLTTYPQCADDFKLVWLPPCMIRHDGAWRLRSTYMEQAIP